MSEYKRLGFLQAYASQATGIAGNVYSQARTLVPSFAETFVQQLEETAINIAVPYVTAAQDGAVKVLGSVDAQVRPWSSAEHACRQPQLVSALQPQFSTTTYCMGLGAAWPCYRLTRAWA